MQNKINIILRAFEVAVKDQRSGEIKEELLALDKAQLQAAQIIGQTGKELINRIFLQQGFKVLEIKAPHKFPLTVDLTELYAKALDYRDEKKRALEAANVQG